MIRVLVLIATLVPGVALAQSASTSPAEANGRHHSMHGQHSTLAGAGVGRMANEPGQSAFAAIQEIVDILEADPATDWSHVNIEALRQHLIDMDNVTLRAEVQSEAIEGGMRFTVSGVGPVKDSIQRMVLAHAATMSGSDGWTFVATRTAAGAILNVTAPASETPKLRALGFLGVMTKGMHHQMHHLMIARGENPHE